MRAAACHNRSQSWNKLPPAFSRVFILVSIFCFGLFDSRSALACQVCVTLPEASLADHLITADVVVMAGPAQDNPFKFAPRQIIKGTSDDLERFPEIPFLIDSTTCAAFRADPEMSVLLTYGTLAKDGARRGLSRKWTRIFTLTPEREKFLEALWTEAELWQGRTTASNAHVAFFARYVSHEDRVLRDTALIEIDRAPYASIQTLRNTVAADALLREFDSLTRMSFVPIAIRLLGLQVDDDKARKIVRSRYPGSVLQGSGYAYDWALAGISVDGSDAIMAVDAALGSANLKQDHKRSLIRALADSGTVSPALRNQIIRIFSRELEQDHSSALEIAIAMRDWNEKRLDSQFANLLENEDVDPVTQFVIQTKLAPKN
ncbi:hypothetical protein [Ruegeria hyattellae]|uniref:hypothetical protein n=1 Tax=Ruegeria hyattellae TaxID=3233337 RepID=UPI00355BFD78